jgi:hypothetical protein
MKGYYEFVEKFGGIQKPFCQSDFCSLISLKPYQPNRNKSQDGCCRGVCWEYVESALKTSPFLFKNENYFYQAGRIQQILRCINNQKNEVPVKNSLNALKEVYVSFNNKYLNSSDLILTILFVEFFCDKLSSECGIAVMLIGSKGVMPGAHTMCLLINSKRKEFKFFDPNRGEACFSKFSDLVNWVNKEMSEGKLRYLVDVYGYDLYMAETYLYSTDSREIERIDLRFLNDYVQSVEKQISKLPYKDPELNKLQKQLDAGTLNMRSLGYAYFDDGSFEGEALRKHWLWQSKNVAVLRTDNFYQLFVSGEKPQLLTDAAQLESAVKEQLDGKGERNGSIPRIGGDRIGVKSQKNSLRGRIYEPCKEIPCYEKFFSERPRLTI